MNFDNFESVTVNLNKPICYAYITQHKSAVTHSVGGIFFATFIEIYSISTHDITLRCYKKKREHLELFAMIKGVPKKIRNDIVIKMIQDLSLEVFTNKQAGQLSGGNQRKLSVGLSLIGNPPIVLLDEPSSGMDPGLHHKKKTQFCLKLLCL